MATAISVPVGHGAEGRFEDLADFRERLYGCLTKRGDAMFGLVDALCSPVAVESLAHLSLAERHERRHGSVYGALAHGRLDAGRLREELVLARDPGWPLVFAVDASTWCRNDADCPAERGYYYHPSRHSNGQPIVAGWAYQWIAQLNWPADSWTAPLDAVRLDPRPGAASTGEQAAGQIRALADRVGPTPDMPLFVSGGGYDPVQLAVALAGAGVQTLTRVKSSRIFHFAAPSSRAARCPAPPRGEVPLRGRGHLARARPGPDHLRSPVRHGLGRRLARSAPAATHLPRRRRSHVDHPWDLAPGAGRTTARANRPGGQGAVAVVGRPRRHRAGPGRGLAGLRSPLRAHLPIRQADLRVDHPEDPHA